MYSELYDIIEKRLQDAGLQNVGTALSVGRSLPSVEPWFVKDTEPDEKIVGRNPVGRPRKFFFAIRITVAKNRVENAIQKQAMGLLDQVRPLFDGWQLPVVGLIGKVKNDENSLKDFSTDGEGVYISVISFHLYTDQFEVQ